MTLHLPGANTSMSSQSICHCGGRPFQRRSAPEGPGRVPLGRAARSMVRSKPSSRSNGVMTPYDRLRPLVFALQEGVAHGSSYSSTAGNRLS